MAVQVISTGQTVDFDFLIGEPSTVYAGAAAFDFLPTQSAATSRSPGMTFSAEADSDGAGPGSAYPGYFLQPNDGEPFVMTFELEGSDTGSFIFPFEFDGASQNFDNVRITGGTISNVVLSGITVDGGSF